MEIALTENLTFFNCAKSGDAPTVKKKIIRNEKCLNRMRALIAETRMAVTHPN